MQSQEPNADVRRGFGRRENLGLHLQRYGNVKEFCCISIKKKYSILQSCSTERRALVSLEVKGGVLCINIARLQKGK
jgi:hypothetical protein